MPLASRFRHGGYFVLEARADADGGRFTTTTTSFYALGDGYTAWQRYDHNRIDLVPERKTYKPGDTARIMIQSPWEQATALVTTEREGMRSHRQFALTSTQQSINVPIEEGDIPEHVRVGAAREGTDQRSAIVRAPRSRAFGGGRAGERPERSRQAVVPARLRRAEGRGRVEAADASPVAANKEEYRPGNPAKVSVDVKDRQGRGAASEVTLWAVDYGVLSLTAYRTPDMLRLGLRREGAAGD